MSNENIDLGLGAALPAQQPQNQLLALAKELGYSGELSPGALEDGIRAAMRRTIEDVLELGARLILLKEATEHGEFSKRLSLLGIEATLARRFMAATHKFSNRASKRVLESVGTQTKLLELLVLDDEELEAIGNGESVGDLNLSEIECMSVSELRQAIRTRDKQIENHAKHNAQLENEKLTLRTELRVAQGRQSMAGYNPQTVSIRMEASAADYGVRLHVDELTALYEAAVEKDAPSAAERELRVTSVAMAVSAAFAHIHALYNRLAVELGEAMPIQPGHYTPLTSYEKEQLQLSIIAIQADFEADKSARATKRKVEQIAKGGKG